MGEFEALLREDRRLEGRDRAISALNQFRKLVLEENEVQNLTRMTTPREFFLGHIWDVLELEQVGWLSASDLVCDVGSGAGVPGIVAAILDNQRWVLTDSEKRKADFLLRAVEQLGLNERVEVYGDRVENVLAQKEMPTLVSRAVGPIGRIYSWIERCSTWNTLILFKGPGWEEEWKDFQGSRARKKLVLQEEHLYRVPYEQEERIRRLVKLVKA